MNKIRKYIVSKLGCKVLIISLQNRNREERYEGVIKNTYKNVFTIILENGSYKSFSYVDILIGNVRVYI